MLRVRAAGARAARGRAVLVVHLRPGDAAAEPPAAGAEPPPPARAPAPQRRGPGPGAPAARARAAPRQEAAAPALRPVPEAPQHRDGAPLPLRARLLRAAPLRRGARLLLRLQGLRALGLRPQGAQAARDIDSVQVFSDVATLLTSFRLIQIFHDVRQVYVSVLSRFSHARWVGSVPKRTDV